MNLVYFYAWNSASGDYQFGYTLDNGAYGYYEGYYEYTPEQNGAYWVYYITDVYVNYMPDNGYTGYTYIYQYYDAETGISVTPVSYAAGFSAGMWGVSSGGDYADLNGNGDDELWEYFNHYHEADYALPDTNFVYYYAWNSVSGDYQFGYTFDDGTYGYYEGWTEYTAAENGGYWVYYVTDVYSGYAAYEAYNGYNWVYSYYDGETGISVTPDLAGDGLAMGYSGMGSGADYADLNGDGINQADESFGSFNEANYVAAGTNLVYYQAWNSATGDYQYGFTFDDGTYNYYVGWSAYMANEDGGYWYYYVTDIYTGYDAYAGYDGYAYVYYYYDGASGIGATPYYYGQGFASGYDGVTSGGDYVDLNGNATLDAWEYFNFYHQADYF